jgi:hypothetical protein
MVTITHIERIPAHDHDFKTADARWRARRKREKHEALARCVEAAGGTTAWDGAEEMQEVARG